AGLVRRARVRPTPRPCLPRRRACPSSRATAERRFRLRLDESLRHTPSACGHRIAFETVEYGTPEKGRPTPRQTRVRALATLGQDVGSVMIEPWMRRTPPQRSSTIVVASRGTARRVAEGSCSACEVAIVHGGCGLPSSENVASPRVRGTTATRRAWQKANLAQWIRAVRGRGIASVFGHAAKVVKSWGESSPEPWGN